MNEVRIEVEGIDGFFGKARAMAERLDRGEAGPKAAAIGFETMETLLKVLTPNRWKLLRVLRRRGGSSIRGLGVALGRDYRGVHADVKALRELGLIERGEDGRISVPWTRITAELSVDAAA